MKAPFSWPNNSDSRTVSDSAAQFNLINALLFRIDNACIALAKHSLPVPLSPLKSTAEFVAATILVVANTLLIAGLSPTIQSILSSWVG